MQVKKISPRGYCHGVVDAITMATNAAYDAKLPKPIYILGMLIHNDLVIQELNKLGVITIDDKNKTRMELLEKIDSGTVIFTAHGISDAVVEKAKEKNLTIIDATCSDVRKTHNVIKSGLRDGETIFYIGKQNHPETESCVSIHENIILIENLEDVALLPKSNDKILITNQTTMSLYDIKNISDAILAKFPNAHFCDEICDATKIRQEAVIEQTKDVDLLIVVGDKKSNNSQKLAQIAKDSNKVESILIATAHDLEHFDVDSYKLIGVTSGASTPTSVTLQVIKYLESPELRSEILKAPIKILPRLKHD